VWFLGGKVKELVTRLETRMWSAAEGERFEVAAHLRDQLDAVKTSLEAQVVTDVGKRLDQDVYGVAREGALLDITRIVVRDGRMVSSSTTPFDLAEFPTEELLLGFLSQVYGADDHDGQAAPNALPDEVLVSLELGHDGDALAALLTEKKGKKVIVREPKRGHAKRLVEIATTNAAQALTDRSARDDVKMDALHALTRRLHLDKVPRVIECFDISLFQGTDAVASQVTFTDGVPDKGAYRRYKIRSVSGTDDFAMIHEAVTRRLQRAKSAHDLPDLLLVDGGKGQLMAALAACKDTDTAVGKGGLMIASIAKARTLTVRGEAARAGSVDDGPAPLDDAGPNEPEIQKTTERIFLPNVKDPIPLRPHTQERFLVEQIRDEAHRFAITAHRAQRKRRTLVSALDDIPGIGQAKRRALLRALGSVAAIRKASLDELAAVDGIGRALALRVRAALDGHALDGQALDETKGANA
jgi:excinuclease ABC subunit C